MKTINNLLLTLNACREAKDWARNKTWEEIYKTCHRGDWLLWLFKRINPNELRELTLAKAYCANTVIHLMKDERSRKAVEVSILFGQGKATREQLDNTRDAAAAYAAAYTAYAAYAAYAARKKNQQKTADLCRKYLPIEIWNIQFDTK